MIKAIIFDFFGVLAKRGLRQFKKEYFGDNEAKRKDGRKLQQDLDKGSLGYDDFIDGLAKIGGTNRDTVLKYTEKYEPNVELLDYIQSKLKPKYKIGIISNAGEDWVLKIIGEQNKKLFDNIILSYKIKSIKPQPEIYELSAKNLGVKPSECIFIDDILSYCHGAENVGMKTIWYQDYDQMKTDLEKILKVSSGR